MHPADLGPSSLPLSLALVLFPPSPAPPLVAPPPSLHLVPSLLSRLQPSPLHRPRPLASSASSRCCCCCCRCCCCRCRSCSGGAGNPPLPSSSSSSAGPPPFVHFSFLRPLLRPPLLLLLLLLLLLSSSFSVLFLSLFPSRESFVRTYTAGTR